jgi:hypothetical protein
MLFKRCCGSARRRRRPVAGAYVSTEERIDRLLAVGVGENPRESLSELAKLGARLIIQRAVQDEFDAWLGRARYERRPGYQRGLRNYESGLGNGFRPRKVRTAEGELQIDILQVRQVAETFASKLFPRTPIGEARVPCVNALTGGRGAHMAV